MKKQENNHTRELRAQLKALENKEANTPWRNRRQEIIKLRAEINKAETRRTIQRINIMKSWLFKENQQDRETSIQTDQKGE